ncbi:MAG TPA: hypothetical protein ENG48_10660 [Candidatus Atribacteria bacterium]|nr:hypothetical protein [Candidatus Atribacteria bacterium]
MLNKRILVIMFLVACLILLVGCIPLIPPIDNVQPEITSTAVTNATVWMKYTYDVDATDDNGDALTYSLNSKPANMNIDSTTGLIEWIPYASQVGDHEVEVEVSDGFLSTTQSFTISVSARTPMEIIVDSPLTFTVSEPHWFKITMIANDDIGKSVEAHFEVPESAEGVDITGTLEMAVGSDVVFLLEGYAFKTEEFTMEDVTANFRGTFDVAGTYSTTVEVKTTDGTLLCSKDIEIVVVEQAVAEQLVVIQNSGQNDINRAADHPYIDWTINGSCIDFEFVNPTAFLFAFDYFDYRVDREIGTITE